MARIIVVDPFDYVVFGGTGDLARRKLFPALYHRDFDSQLPESARIIGVARRDETNESYRADVEDAIRTALPEAEIDGETLGRFLSRIVYVRADGTSDAGWDKLARILDERRECIRVFYLATASDLFGPICHRISKHGLITDKTRLVLEKPIGRDLDSSRAINEAVGLDFPEDRIYRIDHYLGKETVQNLMALRFANVLFEPLWNAAHIDHVQITVAETLGLAERARYYENAGALRDMVQNHMLQMLCLVAMEPPTCIGADAVRDEKLKVLRALKPIEGRAASQLTVRGQYRAGAADGHAVPGYQQELGSDTPPSQTETFVALKTEIDNWRWAGTPFYLRTGKRMPARLSEIVVTFRPIPHSIFSRDTGPVVPNRLVIRLQPDEGIKLWLMIKDRGPGGMRLRNIPLDMTFREAFGQRNPDAYERLLLDVVRGNQTLFMRRDEVEAAWRWIDPILEAWDTNKDSVKPYTAGSWGPSAAIALIERDGRTWYEEDS